MSANGMFCLYTMLFCFFFYPQNISG